MSTVTRNDAPAPWIPVYSDEERARRNAAAKALLLSWVTHGDEQEQRETMAVLREALSAERAAS